MLIITERSEPSFSQEAAITANDLGPTSNSFTSQRLRMHYLDWGNHAAPTLVLVHGGLDHARSWDWTARALRANWHVIAPDLRGHGDSAWSPDGSYDSHDFICDLAQLVHQQSDDQVTIIGHSLGGSIATRYAATFPEKVRKLVSIEGLGPPPKEMERMAGMTPPELMREWVEKRRALASRQPHRYATLEDALERMREKNHQLSEKQVLHLTLHAVSRNEDGSYSWKFDNYVRAFSPSGNSEKEMQQYFANIACPVLLCHGKDSWASDPEADGRSALFHDARVVHFDNAGHWLHHDQFETFLAVVEDFI
jgi:pimeloyl-ACP methyl ester carboxylesterase